MVASKKVHCAFCRKKCTGNVLRYQDQYYHKQCFELEQQSESAAAAAAAATQPLPSHSLSERLQQQQQQVDPRELRARTTGEASGAGPSLYIESAASVASSTPTSTRTPNEPIENEDDHENLHRPASSSGVVGANTNQTTRIFTSHQASNLSHYTSRRQDTYTNNSATANGSLLSPTSRSSSRQNISVNNNNNNNNNQQQPAAMMTSASPHSGRLTSGQLNRVPASPATSNDNQTSERSATLPHSISSPANGFSSALSGAKNQSRTLDHRQQHSSTTNGNGSLRTATCAGCRERIVDGQALIALDLHWHVWCFKCTQCKTPLHGEYVAKDGKAYCERDYQKLFGITCVYCKRYITGKVLQAGEAHHFHPSCARCSKCGDPFVPGEEMYLQGEVTWHPRCGPNPNQGAPESSLMDGDDRSQLRASRAQSPSLSSRSRSASPFSYMSRQYGRASPAYADSEAVGDLSRIYTISYLNADPNQGYLRRPIEPNPPKSPQFSRPTSLSRLGGERSRCSSRSQQYVYGSSTGFSGVPRDRSVPRGMYSVLSGLGRSGSSSRARSPSMMNEEAIQLAAYPSGQKPSPDSVPKIERDDFPAPPFPYPDRHHHQHQQRAHSAAQQQQQQQKHNGAASERNQQQRQNGNASIHVDESVQRSQSQPQERASRPRSREIATADQLERLDSVSSDELDPQFRKEEEELSKIANGIGKIFLQTLKEREKLRAWKRANLDPRNASRTPSATRELPSRLRYENPLNASPSRDMDRPRPWEEDEALSGVGGGAGGEHSPTRTRSSLGRSAASGGVTPLAGAPTPSAISSSYGYKVVQANRSTPRPGYGVTSGHYTGSTPNGASDMHLSFAEQQRIAQARANDLLGRQGAQPIVAGPGSTLHSEFGLGKLPNLTASGSTRSLASAAHLRRSMPNVANLQHLHQRHDGQPPKLYPYHLLATSNYRLPPEVDRCHLERHLSTEEFQYIFHCDRLDFYRLPEWKRNELKRRARLF